MLLKFDTTIKSERIKMLKKLAKKAGLMIGKYHVDIMYETIWTAAGRYYMQMDERATYSARCYLCNWNTGSDIIIT